MAIDFKKIIKGIFVQNEVDQTKGLTVSVDSTAAANTTTNLEAAQSVDRTITLPDASTTLVGTDATQTLTNKTIDGDDNTVQDLALTSLKTNVTDANKFLNRDGSGNVISSDKAVPTGVVVGDSDVQTLSNKTLTSPVINTPTGITKADVGLGNVDDTSDATKNAAVATLTNKTIDGDDNTVQDLALTSLKTDLADADKFLVRDVNGVVVSNSKDVPVGDVVGTSDTQTLTNKTLTSPAITTPTGLVKADVGLDQVDNTSDATKNSAVATLTNKTFGDAITSAQISTPSTPAAGFNRIYPKADGSWYSLTPSGSESKLGAGSGGINYILNGDAESDTAGWATYADAAGQLPVDGTGGSPTVTWTRTTTTPLRGTGSFLFTKDAANRQGQGTAYPFTIDLADRGSMQTITADVMLVSGTYDEGTQTTPSDLTVYIYDVTNAVLLPQPAQYRILPGGLNVGGRVVVEFQASSNSSSYRLIFHQALAGTSAYSLEFDNITCGPSRITRGAIITDWQSYTPTFANLGTPTGVSVFWRRVGGSVEIQGRWTNGTVAGGAATFSLPSGLTGSTGGNDRVVGDYGHQGSATGSEIVYSTANNNLFFGMTNWQTQATGTNMGTSAFTSVNASVPIQGWSSSQQLSSDAGLRRVVFVGTRPTSTQVLTGGVTNIIFNSTEDSLAGWVSDTYTIREAGDYIASGGCYATATNLVNGIYVNGSLSKVLHTAVTNTLGSGSCLLQNLKVGDTINLRAVGSATVANDAFQVFSLHKLSSPQQLAASEKIFFQARKSSVQSIASGSGVVLTNWTNVDVDSTGSFNATTGVYTVPRAGIAKISGQVGFVPSATGSRASQIKVNSTLIIANEGPNTSAANLCLPCSTTFPVKAGDTISLEAFQSSGGAVNLVGSVLYNQLSVEIT